MNVNDLITTGAEPLFFLDYLAAHRIEPTRLEQVINGIAEGCRQARCALLGGETAELPDLYMRNEIELAGFAVGVVELDRAIVPDRVQPGDVLIGLPSSGVHSNGYTLVRRVIKRDRLKLDRVYDELGETLSAALLRPTRLYVGPVLDLLQSYRVKRVVGAMAHITGGGLRENITRVLPEGCSARIETRTWAVPPVFTFLASRGIRRTEMFRTFNMGIGYVLIVRPAFARAICRKLKRLGEKPAIIGRITRGQRKVTLK